MIKTLKESKEIAGNCYAYPVARLWRPSVGYHNTS